MNINVVSKGVVINFIMIITTLLILTFNEFSITEKTFTLMLLTALFLVGIYTGSASKAFSGINGFFVGLISSSILILFVSLYVSLNWELNFMILIVWTTVSMGGSFIGGVFFGENELTRYTDRVRNRIPKMKIKA